MAGGIFRIESKIYQNAIKCGVHDRVVGMVCDDGIELWCKEKHAVVLTWHQMEELLERRSHGEAGAE